MNEPSPASLAQALDLVWVLAMGFIVMFMQVGFAMLEVGFTRARNAVHTMAMNLMIYPLGVIGYFLIGYGVMYGGSVGVTSLGMPTAPHYELTLQVAGARLGWFGASKFALVDIAHDPRELAAFLFGAVFMDTAATIPTGALAERWKLSAFVVYSFFISALLYPLYGNWVWGGGWLAGLGHAFGLGHGVVDFAGSSVVHMTGGVTALAGALVIGPRIGKFRRDGTIGIMPGHNLPMAAIGTGILAFGWFGFNAGSTLTGRDPRIALIAVNTMLASAAGAVTALFYVWQRHKKPDLGMFCNGLLGGLVAITAPCAFVSPAAAALIGLVAGFVVVVLVRVVEQRLMVDDPVGAIAVHGGCGAWGTLAVGLFADGSSGDGWNGVHGGVRGLLFGDASQLVAQVGAVVVNASVVFALAFGFFFVLERVLGNRVSAETELSGLDALEMGSDAYPPG
jgi:Amt family ammonium transporter